MQIAIPIYPAFTALDAIGPYEVLQRLPGAEVVFCSERAEVVRTEQGMLGIAADRTLDQVDRPDIVVVPGGSGTRFLLDPAGPSAAAIAMVWWWMFGVAVVVLAGICVIWLLAMRPRAEAPDEDAARRIQRRWLVGGGLVLPGVSIVALLVFALGLRAGVHDATYLFRRPAALVRAIFVMHVLMPVVAVAVVFIFDFHQAVNIALIALAVSPVLPVLPRKMVKAGATHSHAIGLVVASGVLAIVLVPVAMRAAWQWNRRRLAEARDAGELEEGLTFENAAVTAVTRMDLSG